MDFEINTTKIPSVTKFKFLRFNLFKMQSYDI
jgi:hypothetical protein